MTGGDLAAAVGASLSARIEASEVAGPDRPTLVVAFSGGLDSCVLLHALRFGALRFGSLEASLVAAHFDHRMRPGSVDDASWVRGLCRAWNVPVEMGERGEAVGAREEAVGVRGEAGSSSADGDDVDSVADDVSSVADGVSEAEARRLRYDFLHSVRRRHEPALLLTAHHADDQAETVLFRVLRGTGIDGLSGIPAARAPGIVRPLLPFWREELETYAHRRRLGWREDPTNRDPGYARNLVRHRILPLAEAAAPGARRALVRLSEVAGEERAAWSEALERLEISLDVRTAGPSPAEDGSGRRPMDRAGGGEPPAIVSVDRHALASLGSELRARVVRHLARRHLGSAVLDREATRRAVDFATEGRSGRRIQLGGGVEMARELDRMELRRAPPPGSTPLAAPDRELVIESASAGHGVARLAGYDHRVRWSRTSLATGSSRAHEPTVVLPLDDLAFPLRVRSRRPGDRMSTPVGTRKLKKILLEARVPACRRDRLPVLVDAGGRVLWVPGVAPPGRPAPAAGRPASAVPAGVGDGEGIVSEAALRITITFASTGPEDDGG